MSGYKFVRKDRNKFGGGIAFYINDQLPSRTIKIENPSDIEILTIEITIRKNKILVAGIYKPLSLLNYVPYGPSRLTRFRTLRAFAPYMP